MPYLLAQAIIILLVAFLLYAIFYGLRYAFRQLNFDGKRQQLLLRYSMAGLIIWLIFLAVMAKTGFFQNFDTLPPRTLLIILPPIILTLSLLFSKSFGNVLRVIPPSWLVYIQSFRIVMELFLWYGLTIGLVPVQMTFEGFNYDIIAGITAIGAGLVFFRPGRYRWFEALIWNISGLLLLANIIFIAFISAPAPFRVFMNEPANTMIAYFPFVWIPGFIVPFALAMHLFSIRQGLQRWRKG